MFWGTIKTTIKPINNFTTATDYTNEIFYNLPSYSTQVFTYSTGTLWKAGNLHLQLTVYVKRNNFKQSPEMAADSRSEDKVLMINFKKISLTWNTKKTTIHISINIVKYNIIYIYISFSNPIY